MLISIYVLVTGENIHKDLEGLQIAPQIKQMLTGVFIEFDKLLLGDMIGRGKIWNNSFYTFNNKFQL